METKYIITFFNKDGSHKYTVPDGLTLASGLTRVFMANLNDAALCIFAIEEVKGNKHRFH